MPHAAAEQSLEQGPIAQQLDLSPAAMNGQRIRLRDDQWQSAVHAGWSPSAAMRCLTYAPAEPVVGNTLGDKTAGDEKASKRKDPGQVRRNGCLPITAASSCKPSLERHQNCRSKVRWMPAAQLAGVLEVLSKLREAARVGGVRGERPGSECLNCSTRLSKSKGLCSAAEPGGAGAAGVTARSSSTIPLIAVATLARAFRVSFHVWMGAVGNG